MWNRQELKEKGKLAFKANYWWCVLVAVIMMAATGVSSGSSGSSGSDGDLAEQLEFISAQSGISVGAIIGAVLGIVALGMLIGIVIKSFISNPIEAGGCRFFIMNTAGFAQIGDVVAIFKGGYINTVLTLFLRDLFISLWSLLLIIPGIVKSYEYRMVPYILAEEPMTDRKEAFARSKAMMTGQKWNTFVLDLSFIGWEILSLFTCGILGIFYVNPYVQATNAELYNTLKMSQLSGPEIIGE